MCYCTFLKFQYKPLLAAAFPATLAARSRAIECDAPMRTSALRVEPEWQEILDDAGAQLMRSAVSPQGRDAELAPFRVLILNGNAQLIRFFYLECASAADALDSARELAAGRTAEVWRNGELVGRCGPQV